MPRTEKAGLPIYWTTFGQGPRAALMIHCALSHSGIWGPLAGGLAGALSMTAFDMPGHGRSAAWDGQGEFQAVTMRIAAGFLDAPADIIGHSFGATVALRLAVERPALVRSLTLIEPVFFAVALADDPASRAPFAAQTAELEAAMARGDAFAAARTFTRDWGDGTPWEALPEERRRQMAEGMPLVLAGQAALRDDPGGMLAPGMLAGLSAPALLIEGSESPAIIAAINEGLAARLPSVARAVIMGAAHMAPATHAPQVSAEILQFLERV